VAKASPTSAYKRKPVRARAQNRHLIFRLFAGVLLGLALLLASWAWFDPHATFPEFVTGTTAAFGIPLAALSTFFVPVVEFAVRRKLDRKSVEERMRATETAKSVILPIAMTVAAIAILIGAALLARTPTRFEHRFEQVILLVHQSQRQRAEAELAELRSGPFELSYQTELLRLADLGVKMLKASEARDADADTWQAFAIEAQLHNRNVPSGWSEDAALLYARALAGAQRTDEAQTTLEPVFREGAKTNRRAIAALQLSALWLGRGGYDEANVILSETLQNRAELSPEFYSMVYRARGICSAMKLNWPRALEDFKQSLELTTENRSIAHSNLGFAYVAVKDFANAERHLREASRLAPGDPVPHLNRAISLAEQARYVEARDAIEAAWQLTDRNLTTSRNASNAVLAKALLTWIQVRENPDYITGFIEAVRESQGFAQDSAQVERASVDPSAQKAYFLTAANQLIQHQNLHGLEFIAYDLLLAAKTRFPELAQDPEFLELEGQLPAYAKAWRDPGD